MSKEDLFEGISILSPSEIEDSLQEEKEKETLETGENSEEKKDNKEESLDDGLVIAPVIEDETKTEDGEEKKEKELETKKDNVKDDIKSPTTNAYATFIKGLIKDGVLTAGEEAELEELLKDANADTVKKLMETTLEDGLKTKETSWKNGFTGAKKRFLEIEDSFTNADHAIQMAQRLEFFESVTEDTLKGDENLQKNLYYELLKSKNFSDSDAREAVEEASSIDKLEEKALKALPQLKEEAFEVVNTAKKEKEAQILANQNETKERFNNLISSIDKKTSFIPGMDLTKISKEKLKNNITEPVYTDDKGKKYTSLMYKQLKNPAEFEMLINYYDTLGIFNIDKEGNFSPDLSKLKSIAKTNAVTELDAVLAAEAERGVGRSNSYTDESAKTKSIVDFLDKATGHSKRRK